MCTGKLTQTNDSRTACLPACIKVVYLALFLVFLMLRVEYTVYNLLPFISVFFGHNSWHLGPLRCCWAIVFLIFQSFMLTAHGPGYICFFRFVPFPKYFYFLLFCRGQNIFVFFQSFHVPDGWRFLLSSTLWVVVWNIASQMRPFSFLCLMVRSSSYNHTELLLLFSTIFIHSSACILFLPFHLFKRLLCFVLVVTNEAAVELWDCS